MKKQEQTKFDGNSDRCSENAWSDNQELEGRIKRITPPVVYPDGRMDRQNTALYMGLSPDTLANWASLKKGPSYIRLGGKAFYFKQKVDEYIKQQQSV